MYMGPRTDEPPTPRPPIKRKSSSESQFHARPQPSAEMRYRIAITRRLSRRPLRSPGMPASDAPRIVPNSATATVKPNPQPDSVKVFFNPAVVPEITAVSKPNSRPPSAATTVLLMRVAVILTRAPFLEAACQPLLPQGPALPGRRPGCQAAAAEYIHPVRRVCRDGGRIRSADWRILF